MFLTLTFLSHPKLIKKLMFSGRTECRIGREISNRMKKCRIGCRIGHEIGGIKANHMPFDREYVVLLYRKS